MRWLVLFLLGPAIWAVTFSAVYGLHGVLCAGLVPGPAAVGPEALGAGARMALAGVWLAGLAAAGTLLWALPPATGKEHLGSPRPALLRASALIGLGATFFTLFPVIMTTSC